MNKALWEYGRVLGLVCLVFAVYMITVVPWIEPPKVDNEGAPEEIATSAIGYWWDEIFPEGAWQRKSPKVLETGQGILLFETWENIGAQRWRLKPLTILIPPDSPRVQANGGGAKMKRPLVIDASEGAVIQFKDVIDITSGKTPPLDNGQLLGRIRMYSPATEDQAEDDFELITAKVRIDRRKIWTSEAVELRFGKSYARGRDLSIFLDKNLLASGSDGGSSWDGLDRLELIYVDEVLAQLPPGGLFANMDNAPKGAATNPAALLPAQMRIKCDGAFRFDFHRSVASLQDHVVVTHEVQGLPADQFLCSVLRIFADRADAVPAVAPTPANSGAVKVGPFLVKKLEAEGQSTGSVDEQNRLVRLNAPSMQAAGYGRWLTMDLSERRVSWVNRLPNEPVNAEQIFMQHKGAQFWTPEIHYRMSPDPSRLGWLSAAGPGHVIAKTEQEGVWETDWTKSLQMVPDGPDERVTIDGDAVITSIDRGRFSAATMDLWLRPSSTSGKPAIHEASSPLSGWKWLPDRMEAVGKVDIQSPQLQGSFSQMAVWFAYVTANQVAPPAATNSDAISLNTSSGQPLQMWVNQPADTATPKKQSKMPQGPPIFVSGHRLHGRLLWTPESTVVDDMTIQGGVTLRRESIDPSNPLPMQIQGDQLRMNTADGGMADVAVSGQPARVSVGAGGLSGPVVRLNQRDRLIWIDQAGDFEIPPEAIAQKGGAGNSQMRWLEAPKCNWKGRMLFDGRTARMDGGVKITGRIQTDAQTVWHLDGSSQVLELQLTEAIGESNNRRPGAQSSANRTQVELQKVALIDNVDLRGVQTDLSGVRRSIEHLMVPYLEVNVPTQKMVGQGPGSLRSRRPSKSEAGALPGQLASARAGNLNCLHLTFANQLEGFLDRMEFVFSQQVEVGMGPIRNWDEAIDVRNLQQLDIGQTLLSCRVLRAYDSGKLPSASPISGADPLRLGGGTWDLEALRNVVFEGRTEQGDFAGSADRLAYDAGKDVVRIVGDGRTPGAIQRSLPGQSPTRLSVQDASFRLKTMEILDMKLDQLQLDFPGGNPANLAAPALPNGTNPGGNGIQPLGNQPFQPNSPQPTLPQAPPTSPRDILFPRRGGQ